MHVVNNLPDAWFCRLMQYLVFSNLEPLFTITLLPLKNMNAMQVHLVAKA